MFDDEQVMFNDEQKKFINSLLKNIDFSKPLSDDDYCDIIEAVSEDLQLHGIEMDDVNEHGEFCESILDLIP